MKKKLLLLAATGILAFSLSSCGMIEEINNYRNLTKISIDTEGKEMKLQEVTVEEITGYETELTSILSNGGTYESLASVYEEFSDAYSRLDTNSAICYVNYQKTMGSEEYDKYDYYTEALTDTTSWVRSFYKSVYASSYKDQFYADWSEEEITDMLNTPTSEKYYTLSKEADDLLSRYDSLSSNSKIGSASGYYDDLIEIYSQMALLADYSDYMDYAYDVVYSRNYTPKDTTTLSGYVREYIFPELVELNNKMAAEYGSDDSGSVFTEKERYEINFLLYGNYQTRKSYMDDYAKELGGSFLSNYNHLWKDGYYCFTANEESSGAFTTYLMSYDEPVLFFGDGYQNLITVVHEFGHYNAAMNYGALGADYDLSELQSQGDELLFYAYLKEKSNLSDKVLDYVILTKMISYLGTVVMATAVNNFEINVYDLYNLGTKNISYNNEYINVLNNLGGYEEFYSIIGYDPCYYWPMVALDNAGYYISYAISLIPALCIYYEAENVSFDSAKEKYLKLADDSAMSFEAALADVGMTSPFEEDTYKKIADIL